MLYKINSIFYSIIGEGVYTGTPAVFIRLAGCNKRCKFCDTDHSEKRYGTEKDIKELIDAYPSSVVVITGGEPFKQNLWPLLKILDDDWRIETHIETNGTYEIPDVFMEKIGWLTISPKGKIPIPEENWKKADEVKVLCGEQKWKAWIKTVNSNIGYTSTKWLMPLDRKGSVEFTKAIDFVKNNPDWRLCAQVHKCIGVE